MDHKDRDTTEGHDDFVTVARFFTPTDAHVVCACLEAAGIPALVADANLVQANSLWTTALGGVRLLVPSNFEAEAKAVIEAFERGDFALPDDDQSYPDPAPVDHSAPKK